MVDKNVLIIGATGFIGKRLALDFAASGAKVVGVARKKSSCSMIPIIPFDRKEDYSLLFEGLSQIKMLNKWSLVVDCCLNEPLDLNLTQKLSTKHYIMLSSGSVYDYRTSKPIDERASLVSSIDSAISSSTFSRQMQRVEAEQMFKAWSVQSKCSSLILRLGIVFGPGDYSQRIRKWVQLLLDNKLVQVPVDTVIPFVDVRDISRFILNFSHWNSYDLLNVGANPDISPPTLIEVVKLAANAFSLQAKIVPVSSNFLIDSGVVPWTELPLWAPVGTPAAHLLNLNSTRAQQAGFIWREWRQTISSYLNYYRVDMKRD